MQRWQRLTTIPLKDLFDLLWIICQCSNVWKLTTIDCGLHLDKRNIFHVINKGLKGAGVNRALPSLHGWLSEITLPVLLMLIQAHGYLEEAWVVRLSLMNKLFWSVSSSLYSPLLTSQCQEFYSPTFSDISW